jgi:hypothetical protein
VVCATYCWKDLDKGYNFDLEFTSIKGLNTKLWASKVAGIPILGLPLRSFETKWHLGASPMTMHKEYCKGEGGGFPQMKPSSPCHSESCESVFTCGSSVHQKCSSYALTNLLFGLCKFVWVIVLLVILSSPYPRATTCPSTLEVLQVRECAPTHYPSVVFTFRLPIESTKEFGDESLDLLYHLSILTQGECATLFSLCSWCG